MWMRKLPIYSLFFFLFQISSRHVYHVTSTYIKKKKQLSHKTRKKQWKRTWVNFRFHNQFPSSFFTYKWANRIRFHVSGNPGRHQCMQSAWRIGSALSSAVSILPPVSVYTDVCASMRYSESCVMLMTVTCVAMCFTTLDTTFIISLLEPVPQKLLSFIGSVSLKHLGPFGFPQSALLHVLHNITLRLITKYRVWFWLFYVC